VGRVTAFGCYRAGLAILSTDVAEPSHRDAWSPLIDSHAHIFLRELPLAENATFRPSRSVTEQDYLDILDRESIQFGVLTAPSFLGTYNDYTLAVLRRNRRLRGTAIVDPAIDPYTLRAMADDGIVGIRYSLRRYPDIPDFTSPAYRRLLRRVQDLDWFVHIMAESDKLAALVPILADSGVKLVVDHFGVPEKSFSEDRGLQAIMRAVQAGRTWIKLAAPYRTQGSDMKGLARKFLSAAGPERLLWGSDWPWTGHEGKFSYRDTVDWFKDWIPEQDIREKIGRTALALHGFA
jgi:predicted TIM-barrel fold metal-dependent hydrolase